MISQVTIKINPGGRPREVWFFFETDHASLLEMKQALASEGVVYGIRIESEPAGPGRRQEVGRKPAIFNRETIASVIPPEYDLLPPEGGR